MSVILYVHTVKNKKTIHKYLEGNINFSYQTSITSGLNEKERADVYSTDLSVDDAAKAIIQAIDGGTEDVQKNGEDDSVAILTKGEYCLVYTSTDQTTMVQISSCAYVYQSTNTPYHATGHTHSYYRGFYYSRGFFGDRDRYRQRTSGYENYSGETVDTNPVDPQKLFRQRPPEQHQFQALIRRRNQLRQIGEKRRKRQESKPAVCIRTKPNQKEKIMAEFITIMVYCVLGTALMLFGTFVVDLVIPCEFPAEIKKGMWRWEALWRVSPLESESLSGQLLCPLPAQRFTNHC